MDQISELRVRPKSDYLKTASWDEFYILTEHWQSDMEFYRDELRFLKNLLVKYFVWLTKEENVSDVHDMVTRLDNLDRKRDDISEKIQLHLHDIELLIENAFSHDEQKFRDDQSQLEEDIAQFVKDVRKAKNEVFKLAEYVIESEKLEHLLGPQYLEENETGPNPKPRGL